MDFLGILEANDGSIWFGSGGGVYRYDGKTITDLDVKRIRNIAHNFKIELCFRRYIIQHRLVADIFTRWTFNH